jgi:hypothetical protein
MARARTAPVPLTAPPGFIASAATLPVASRNEVGRRQNWQAQAWRRWEDVPELRYVSTWIGNVLSRGQLVAAKRNGQMLEPVTSGPAKDAMDALYGGLQGQAEMQRLYGLHHTVAGESYIVNLAKDDRWYTLAYDKVTQSGEGDKAELYVEINDGVKVRVNKGQDLVIRMWDPHPLAPTLADSPTRACLQTLAQIVGYDAHINAQIRSRLSGNGILFISNEIDIPIPEGADPNATPASVFLKILTQAINTAIENPDDPSALAPIIAMVPTESLGKNEHVTFWSDLDNKVIEMRAAAFKRFAISMDVPEEVLTGSNDSNHWNVWFSDEAGVKVHTEPRLAMLSHGLTEKYLRPALKNAVADPQEFYVMADTSNIRLRPNRAKEAIELFDRGELDGDTLRLETGFPVESKPSRDENITWLLRRMATGAASPEMVAAALLQLGVNLGPLSEPLGLPPNHIRLDTQPTLEERNPPPVEGMDIDMNDVGLMAACDTLVFRALERAGNRLRNRHKQIAASIKPHEVHLQPVDRNPNELLAGMWDDYATQVIGQYVDDVAAVIDTLNFYVGGLLQQRHQHQKSKMELLLRKRPATVPLGR